VRCDVEGSYELTVSRTIKKYPYHPQ